MNQPSGNKTNTTLIVIIAAVVVIGAGAGVYLATRKTNQNANTAAGNTAAVNRNVNATANATTAVDGLYVGDDFTVTQPAGWVQGQIPGTLVSFQNIKESHAADSAAAKINFKSYIAVSFDNRNGQSLDQVYQTTIDGITASIPATNIFATSNETVNSLPAKFAAMELSQQDVAYTVLMTIYIADGKYYVMSFNTTTEKWIGYKDKFYEVARSFKLKT